MDLAMVFAWLSGLHPVVPYFLMGAGTLVIAGQTYVWLTPSKTDDAWWEKLENVPVLGSIMKALKSFAPIQRKPPK